MNRSDPLPVVCATVIVFVDVAVPDDVASTAIAPKARCGYNAAARRRIRAVWWRRDIMRMTNRDQGSGIRCQFDISSEG
jgi:hypothetical protein